MNFSKAKAVLTVGLVSAALAVLVAAVGLQPTAAKELAQAGRPATGSAVEKNASGIYEPGTLVKGEDHFVYYITGQGTRQPIYDQETFLAFGFDPDAVIKADQELLAEIPLDHVLTRLVFDKRGNLYWVMDGQRRLVNEWKPVLSADSYQDLPTAPLADSLAETLPQRWSLKSGTFFRDHQGKVYYFLYGKIIPVRPNHYNETEAVDLPAGVLSVYQQQETLERLVTRLNAETEAANVRRGPGTEFEAIGTISAGEEIIAKGRTEAFWLKIEFQGQTGWLAGDLVEEQNLLPLLPVVDTGNAAGQAQPTNNRQETSPSAYIYTGVGGHLEYRNNSPVHTALVERGPAQRAGVRVGDVLLAIDDRSVSGLTISQMVDQIRGEAGSQVTLTVFRPETNQTLDIPIIREEINLLNVAWTCADQPIRGFGKVWQERPETHRLLGCPFTNWRQDEHATPAAVQTFEHGWMLWLETDTVANVDPIYVFYEDDGSYIRYGDRPLADAHQYAPTEPGFYKVGDRFAKVYWEEIGPEGRTRLGRAINEARDSKGAFQEFQKGRMFWAGQSDTIYVIYQGYYDVDEDGQPDWVQGWTSYEDTFEAGEEEQ